MREEVGKGGERVGERVKENDNADNDKLIFVCKLGIIKVQKLIIYTKK